MLSGQLCYRENLRDYRQEYLIKYLIKHFTRPILLDAHALV